MTDHAEEFVPTTPKELSRFLAENAAGERKPLCPVGGRTALNFGYPPARPTVAVSTARMEDVIDYPARDMTVTVGAGIRIDQLGETLAAERQQLPIDIPHSHRATLGGAIATGVSGPRRFGYGTFRDYVIGIAAVDAQGRSFHSGGRVVKNVAGYDLCKLMIGSLGTLAILTEVTLKLKPIPEASALVWSPCEDEEAAERALERLVTSATRPVVIDVLNPRAAGQIAAESRVDLPLDRPVLIVGVEGTVAETEWQVRTLEAELGDAGIRDAVNCDGDAGDKLRQSLGEYLVGADEPLTFRASLRPSQTIDFVRRASAPGIGIQAHAGNGIVIGHLPDAPLDAARAAEMLEPLCRSAREAGGQLVILDCPEAWKETLPLFGDPPPAWELMRQVKRRLDPDDLLNPGRLFRD